MFFGIPRINTRVSWTISDRNAPEAADEYPARINDVQGRQVSLFVLRQNKDGTPRLDHVLTSVNFISARESLVEELDAPTLKELEGLVMAEKAAYLAGQAADAAV